MDQQICGEGTLAPSKRSAKGSKQQTNRIALVTADCLLPTAYFTFAASDS